MGELKFGAAQVLDFVVPTENVSDLDKFKNIQKEAIPAFDINMFEEGDSEGDVLTAENEEGETFVITRYKASKSYKGITVPVEQLQKDEKTGEEKQVTQMRICISKELFDYIRENHWKIAVRSEGTKSKTAVIDVFAEAGADSATIEKAKQLYALIDELNAHPALKAKGKATLYIRSNDSAAKALEKVKSTTKKGSDQTVSSI